MSTSRLPRIGMLLVGLGALTLLLQAALLLRGVDYITSTLTIDDSYYYLQTAWNTAHSGVVSFDGRHATNGVQLVWFWLLVPLALIAPTKSALLYSALGLTILLNVACYLIIWKLHSLLQRPALTVCLASGWTWQVLTTRTYLMGMENALHALIFWCVLWQMVALLLDRRGQSPHLLPVTLLLVLNAWTRLDAALFSVLLYGYCILVLVRQAGSVRAFGAASGRLLAGSLLLASAGAALQLLTFRLMGGSWLPVSFLVKSAQFAWSGGSEALIQVARGLAYSLTPPARFAAYIPRYETVLALVAGVVGSVAALLVGSLPRVAAVPMRREVTVLRGLWLCLLVAVLLYYAIAARASLPPDWYLAPVHIFWVLTFGLAADLIASLLTVRGRRFGGWVLAALTTGTLAGAVALFAVLVVPQRTDMYALRYQAARWIAEQKPPDSVYAAWNAGQMGFFADQTVINLDGLANNARYVERITTSEHPAAELMAYLCENEVDYLVDYTENAFTARLPVEQTFPADPAGRRIHLWQVAPLCSDDRESLLLRGNRGFGFGHGARNQPMGHADRPFFDHCIADTRNQC